MRKRNPSRLHLLSVRELQTAGDGDHVDGGGLILRVQDKLIDASVKTQIQKLREQLLANK